MMLYTRLSVEEALKRLANSTAKYPGLKKLFWSGQQDVSNKKISSNISEQKFSIGITDSWFTVPIISGAIAKDDKTGITRVKYRIYGVVSMAAAASIGIVLGKIIISVFFHEADILIRSLAALISVVVLFPVSYLLNKRIWGRKEQRLKQFLKDIFEAQEQIPVEIRNR